MVIEKSHCVIGIDGGASSTRAALMREGLIILAEGRGGPADHFTGEAAKERLERSIREAVSPLSSFLDERDDLEVGAVFLGLTGDSIPGKKEAASEILSEMFPQSEIMVDSDAVIAWAGALSGQSGVTVIAGTGSVAYGRHGQKEVRKGGFGYLFGGEGGGFRVACHAVSAALLAADGSGPPTSLSNAAAEFFGVKSITEVPVKVYSQATPIEEIAAFCPIVAKEAEAGDKVAREILMQAARSLAQLAVSALRELGSDERIVSYAGGLFNSGDILLEPFKQEILREIPDAEILPPRYPPYVGAGILAWNKGAVGRHKKKQRYKPPST